MGHLEAFRTVLNFKSFQINNEMSEGVWLLNTLYEILLLTETVKHNPKWLCRGNKAVWLFVQKWNESK